MEEVECWRIIRKEQIKEEQKTEGGDEKITRHGIRIREE